MTNRLFIAIPKMLYDRRGDGVTGKIHRQRLVVRAVLIPPIARDKGAMDGAPILLVGSGFQELR
jgi:hypothetical protein